MTGKRKKAKRVNMDIGHIGSPNAVVTREDAGVGWNNLLTKQGIIGSDKQIATDYARAFTIPELTLDAMYRSEGFAKRIVDLPNEEIMRKGFIVTGDTDNNVNKALAEIDGQKLILNSLQWADAFGGSLLIIGANDGEDFEDPLNENKIDTIEFFRAYDRFRVTWTSIDLYDDPMNSKFGTPQWYTINPYRLNTFRIHESRVVIFQGETVSDRQLRLNKGWGDSIYQSCFLQLSDLAGVNHATKTIMDSFIETIIQIDNFQDLLVAGRENEIKERLNLMDLSRHVLNAVILDTKEKYTKQASSVAGIREILDKFAENLSAVRGIPISLLMGRSAAGMNSTGEGEISQWYDKIAGLQKSKLWKPLRRIIHLLNIAKDNKVALPEDWMITFNPLFQPSEKETADTRRINAETDSTYLDRNVILPTEVRESRFGGDEYSAETILDDSATMSLIDKESDSDLLRKQNLENAKTQFIDKNEENTDSIEPKFIEVSFEDNHNHFGVIDIKGNGELFMGGADGHTHIIKNGFVQTTQGHTHRKIIMRDDFPNIEEDSVHLIKKKKKRAKRAKRAKK